MSESARFELVEGATFQLPDGSSVTVRDGGLEMSDGRRLPMPAAGEAITVERTVPRPDGGTTRIKHTIRLSDAEPIVEKPARPFAGAGPGDEEQDVTKQDTPGEAADGEVGETVPAPASAVVAETAPKAESEKTDGEKDSGSAAQGPESSSAEVGEDPNKKTTPAAEAEKASATSVTPGEPTLMGVNCGRRSLRAMLWGSIPESGLEDDEDEPKAPPKGLLQKSYSIKEEDESEHEDHEEDHEETHEEPLESSENADESFEFVDEKAKGERKDSDSGDKKESEAAEKPNEEKVAEQKPENDSASENVNKAEPVQGDNTKKVTVVTFDTSTKPGDDPQKTDDGADKPSASSADDSSPQNKRDVEEEPEKESNSEAPGAEFLAEQAAAVMATTASLDQPAPPPSEPSPEKPHLTRQEKLPSSGNLVAQDDVVVRVGVPLVDASPEKKPVAAAQDTKQDDESAPSPDSEDASPAGARSDEVANDLHLKLTPILRSLETDEPKSSRSGDNGERAAKKAPSEDRKGTVPPNTPAVAEDRECLLGSDEPEDAPEPVSVPKVVSYFEGISPRSSPAPTRQREPDSSTVPKVIKFAVPMEPEKVYLDGQEPEDMEDTPIPRGDSSKPADSSEPPARVELAPEPVTVHQQTLVLVPVRGTPDDVDPLTALAAGETGEQPSPEGRERRESEDPATPSTTPEKDAAPDSGDAPSGDGDTDQQKPGPPVYKPELFEPEPKRPLILTSEMVDEDAPPYEPGVHDARTLPIGRRGNVVTEQPPPFGDDDRSDPRDPFLPDHPRPGHGIKEHGWLNTCFDLCCCCWAP